MSTGLDTPTLQVSFLDPTFGYSRRMQYAPPERRRLATATLVSLVLHAGLLVAVAGTVPPAPPRSEPAVITARLESAPPKAEPPKPAAPPEVLKNTLDAPQAKPLEDPIKPQPPRRVADKAVVAPKREVPPKPPTPKPEEVAKAETPGAQSEPLGRGLDLRLPREPRAERLAPEELRDTMRRLSEEMLYPADALQRGLEGEVVILVEIGEGGRILDASIATGSGHRSLDEAAVRAVRKLGQLGPSTANRSILLPVRFRIVGS
jgi:protein TonB